MVNHNFAPELSPDKEGPEEPSIRDIMETVNLPESVDKEKVIAAVENAERSYDLISNRYDESDKQLKDLLEQLNSLNREIDYIKASNLLDQLGALRPEHESRRRVYDNVRDRNEIVVMAVSGLERGEPISPDFLEYSIPYYVDGLGDPNSPKYLSPESEQELIDNNMRGGSLRAA